MAENSVYKGIMQGLQEAIEYKQGDKSKARVRVRSKVDPVQVSTYNSDGVTKIRKSLNLSQRGLALAIGVSPRTVESWEAGKSVPSGVATRMLYLIDKDNSLIDNLVVRSSM